MITPENEQGNEFLNEQEGLKETNLSGDTIRQGANQEDQLDKIKANIPEGGRDAYPEKQAGTPPNTEPPSNE